MTNKVDRRLEALKELGAMLAESYRQKIAKGNVAGEEIPKHQASSHVKYEFEVFVNPHDPECDGLYTETVKIEHFIRNHKSHARKLIARKNAA